MKDHFEKFLGLGNVSDNENDLLAYGYDASEMQGKARLVLFPSQDEQLRLIISYANRSNIDVVVRGNGSNINGMTIPNNSLVVSMQGFDRIHALNVTEGWVKVDAGVTIAELNDALKEQGFRFPLDTSSRKQNTIGGLIAKNGYSRYSVKYGRASDICTELEIIDGSGKVITVKKNISDYVGLEGTTVIIIRATIKIIPLRERSADIHFFDTLTQAIEFVDLISKEKPLSIDFLDQAAATYAGFNTRHTIIVEWEGDRGSMKHEVYASTLSRRDQLRKNLGNAGYTRFEDGQVPIEQLEYCIRWCESKNLPVVSHAGSGVVHPFMKQEQQSIREEWCAWLSEHGSVSGQHGYGLRKKAYVPQEIKSRLRRLKEQSDYNNILGRGKLYDYI